MVSAGKNPDTTASESGIGKMGICTYSTVLTTASQLVLVGFVLQQLKIFNKNGEGPSMRVCGVDPGLGGAVAFIRPDAKHPPSRLAVFDAPLIGNEFDGVAFAKMLAERLPDTVAIEHAFSRPGQGVASTFKFGQTFGQAL